MNENANVELVRPSALPKLAACRCYESKPGSSEAAERGTRIDRAIRVMWARMAGDAWAKDEELPDLPSVDEKDAVVWAMDQLDELSHDGAMHLETQEEKLKALSKIDTLKNGAHLVKLKDGTMDGLCVEGAFLVDFKSGQVRNYKEQMAAYALSCMDEYFADEWTAHLLFVDQRQRVSLRFTAEEARAIVQAVLERPCEPEHCEYCTWCAKFTTCPVVTGAVAAVQQTPALPACTAAAKSKGELPDVMAAMLTDHAKAHEFLSKLAVVNDWADVLKTRIKTALTPEDGAPAADDKYFQRVVMAGRKVVMPLALGHYLKELGWQRILGACSAIPLAKVEEIWREMMPDKPMPADMVTTAGGSVQLRLRKVKK